MRKNFNNLNDFYEEFKSQLTANAPNSVKFEDYVKKFEFGDDGGERIRWVDENGKEHWKIFNPWLAVDLSGKEENSLLFKPPYWEYTSEYRPHYEIYEKLKKMFSDYSHESKIQEKKPTKKDDSSNNDYKTWTREQLIAEINRLKTENKELKSNKSLTNSEKANRLQKNQEKLEKLSSYYENIQTGSQPINSNDKFPIGLIIGGAILLVVGGLLAVLIYKNKKSKK